MPKKVAKPAARPRSKDPQVLDPETVETMLCECGPCTRGRWAIIEPYYHHSCECLKSKGKSPDDVRVAALETLYGLTPKEAACVYHLEQHNGPTPREKLGAKPLAALRLALIHCGQQHMLEMRQQKLVELLGGLQEAGAQVVKLGGDGGSTPDDGAAA